MTGEDAGRLCRADGEELAWRRVRGLSPTVLWLGGFHSDMSGTKAEHLAAWAHRNHRDFLRFDYFGHGASSGDFTKGTIGRWRDDVLAVLDDLTTGPVCVVGSSMGGWLALLAAKARPVRIADLVLIAPATDFTERLMGPGLPPEAKAALARDGQWTRPSPYEDGGYVVTAELLEEGRRWCLLDQPISFSGRVRILQGTEDPDVPWTHALQTFQALTATDMTFTLIRDGDHRLSRPQDLELLSATLDGLSVIHEG